MKKFYALLVIIFFSIYIQAQTNTNITEVSKTNSAKSKLEIPPEKAKPITIPKTSVGIVIDGKIDEELWKQAAVFKDFYQTYPGDNTPASKPTEVLMMYDEKNLYVAFKCWDEKDKIRATVAKRDEVFGEDNVRLWLDTYNDQRRAYVLGFNPFGIQQDGIFTEGRGADFSVDIVMESKGVIEDWGWAVEVKIPFKSLRYTAGKGKMWGFNVARNIDRLNDEFDQWLPDDRNVSGFLIKHGKITGLDEIKYERTLEIVPSVTLSETGRRFGVFPDGSTDRFVNQPIKQDIGVTLKYTLSPNVTLDLAYNPDFAEIEADAPVVSANQRFPIFFQEKRPFFLEGADIFNTPLQVFYSRTIVDPDIAAKLTGKTGKTSFGFLIASDKAPGNYGEDDLNDRFTRARVDEFIDRNATFGVLRVKRDIGKENNIGFFTTYRSFPEQKNLVAGFDGRFKLDDKTVFQFQVAGSNSRRCFFENDFEPLLNQPQTRRNQEICGGFNLDNTFFPGSSYQNYRTGNGIAYFANIDHTAETFGYTVEIGGRSKDYRSDAGFNRRSNSNYAFGGMRLSTKSKPKNKIIRVSWFNNLSMNYDWQGRSQGLEWGSNVNFQFQGNTSLSFNGGIGYERIFEEEFGLKRMPSRPTSGAFFGDSERSTKQGSIAVEFEKQINEKISFSIFGGTIFNTFDFDFGAGERFPRVSPAALLGSDKLDPGAGQQYDFSAELELKPINPLRISLEYNKNVLVRKDTNKTAFDSNIATIRATYQFTRFVFVRTRLDFDSLSSNFSGQYLVGWNPSPGKAFYVGYNDDFNYNGFNPYSGDLEQGFQRNSRTFFIRFSYLFRKSF